MTGQAHRGRLLHITTTDISLELLLGPQLRAFAAAGYEVHTASAPGPFAARLRADGIEHHPLRHATRSMAPHRDVAALAELYRLMRHLRPDIVHTHNPKPGVYGRLAARAARVPGVVNTVHGLYALPEDRRSKRLLVYGLERLAAAGSDVELVQNPEDLPVLDRLGIRAPKARLLGNGIDLGRFRPGGTGDRAALRAELGVDDDEVVVGAVGRLVREKGYGELFAAAAELRARGVRCRFVVVGPSDAAKADALTDEEIDRARAAGVVLCGFRDDVDALYSAFDVFVLASYREGYPRAAMEASATGLPVVATDIRGCRQVVDDGTTGVLVPPRDAAALASAIERLVGDGDLRRGMGEAAAERARREFDQQRVIDITLAAYDEVASRPAATRS